MKAKKQNMAIGTFFDTFLMEKARKDIKKSLLNRKNKGEQKRTKN